MVKWNQNQEEYAMFILKLLAKILLLPVILILGLLRLLVHIGINLSSIVLGGLMLIVFGCIVFTIIQHTWNSMAILITMEVFLVLITAGAGVIEAVLEMASDSLGGFMRM
ncbi:MAG: hypothetical protein IKN58_11055 [Prevotella sp.]|nr:hypothetical protein [Prevotella sp.]